MDLTSFGGLAIGGAVIGFWNQFKAFFGNVISLGLITVDFPIECWHAQDLLKNLINNSKIYTFGNKSYGTMSLVLKDQPIWMDYFSHSSKNFLFLYNNRIPIFVSVKNNKLYLRFFRKSFNYSNILAQIYKDNTVRIKENFKKHTYFEINIETFYQEGDDIVNFSSSVRQGEPQGSPTMKDASECFLHNKSSFFHDYKKILDIPGIDSLNLSNEFKYEAKSNSFYFSKEHLLLKKHIEFWLENEKWYMDRGMNHVRGCLCYSAPGTGKSRGIVEIAKELKLTVNILYLSGATNERLKNKIKNYSNCILLFEDFDNVFHGRENVTKTSQNKDKLSFDFFINCLSGAKGVKNCFVIITTNDITKIDQAILRDGRIDLKIEFKALDEEGRRHIAARILSDWPEIIEEMVKTCEGQTGAQFENACVTRAIDLKWRELDTKTTIQTTI